MCNREGEIYINRESERELRGYLALQGDVHFRPKTRCRALRVSMLPSSCNHELSSLIAIIMYNITCYN